MKLCRLSLWFGAISLIFLNMALELNANTIDTESTTKEEGEVSLESSSSTEGLTKDTTEELQTDYSTTTKKYEERKQYLDAEREDNIKTPVDNSETPVKTNPGKAMSTPAIAALIVLVVGIAIFAGYLRHKYNHRTSYNL